jgi:hypothetical protein
MTKQQFEAAVAALMRDGRAAIQDEVVMRVFIAAGTIVRNRRCGLSSNAPYFPTDQ